MNHQNGMVDTGVDAINEDNVAQLKATLAEVKK